MLVRGRGWRLDGVGVLLCYSFGSLQVYGVSFSGLFPASSSSSTLVVFLAR